MGMAHIEPLHACCCVITAGRCALAPEVAALVFFIIELICSKKPQAAEQG
jgi:hypothetical protein